MPACPACPVAPADGTGVGPADRTGAVKIFAFLELEPRLNIKTNLTGQAKLNILKRSQKTVGDPIPNFLLGIYPL